MVKALMITRQEKLSAFENGKTGVESPGGPGSTDGGAGGKDRPATRGQRDGMTSPEFR
jgi:hypothetical protein